MAAETDKQRETVVQTETEREESPDYLDKPHSMCSVSVCVCVLRPARFN